MLFLLKAYNLRGIAQRVLDVFSQLILIDKTQTRAMVSPILCMRKSKFKEVR